MSRNSVSGQVQKTEAALARSYAMPVAVYPDVYNLVEIPSAAEVNAFAECYRFERQEAVSAALEGAVSGGGAGPIRTRCQEEQAFRWLDASWSGALPVMSIGLRSSGGGTQLYIKEVV